MNKCHFVLRDSSADSVCEPQFLSALNHMQILAFRSSHSASQELGAMWIEQGIDGVVFPSATGAGFQRRLFGECRSRERLHFATGTEILTTPSCEQAAESARSIGGISYAVR